MFIKFWWQSLFFFGLTLLSNQDYEQLSQLGQLYRQCFDFEFTTFASTLAYQHFGGQLDNQIKQYIRLNQLNLPQIFSASERKDLLENLRSIYLQKYPINIYLTEKEQTIFENLKNNLYWQQATTGPGVSFYNTLEFYFFQENNQDMQSLYRKLCEVYNIINFQPYNMEIMHQTFEDFPIHVATRVAYAIDILRLSKGSVSLKPGLKFFAKNFAYQTLITEILRCLDQDIQCFDQTDFRLRKLARLCSQNVSQYKFLREGWLRYSYYPKNKNNHSSFEKLTYFCHFNNQVNSLWLRDNSYLKAQSLTKLFLQLLECQDELSGKLNNIGDLSTESAYLRNLLIEANQQILRQIFYFTESHFVQDNTEQYKVFNQQLVRFIQEICLVNSLLTNQQEYWQIVHVFMCLQMLTYPMFSQTLKDKVIVCVGNITIHITQPFSEHFKQILQAQAGGYTNYFLASIAENLAYCLLHLNLLQSAQDVIRHPVNPVVNQHHVQNNHDSKIEHLTYSTTPAFEKYCNAQYQQLSGVSEQYSNCLQESDSQVQLATIDQKKFPILYSSCQLYEVEHIVKDLALIFECYQCLKQSLEKSLSRYNFTQDEYKELCNDLAGILGQDKPFFLLDDEYSNACVLGLEAVENLANPQESKFAEIQFQYKDLIKKLHKNRAQLTDTNFPILQVHSPYLLLPDQKAGNLECWHGEANLYKNATQKNLEIFFQSRIEIEPSQLAKYLIKTIFPKIITALQQLQWEVNTIYKKREEKIAPRRLMARFNLYYQF